MRAFRIIVCVMAFLYPSSGILAAPKTRTLVVERAVLVMRHGIRAPLDGEVPDGTHTGVPWPRWPVAASRITPHGIRALEIVAAADRRLLASHGLRLDGCPGAALWVHSNSSDRTIASGEAYTEGFAPGCNQPVEHMPLGAADPIFEPLRAGVTRFDATAAIAAIRRETGGMAALVRRHRSALALLERTLDCRPVGSNCLPAIPVAIAAGAEGEGISLSGPIRTSSGIAQVLLLEYLEGMPQTDVGWGRIAPSALKRLGTLHAALFAVFTRPSYMAAHQSAELGRSVITALLGSGPQVTVLMGHDTNVTALAATLRIELEAPGYATNDVPPGGALLLERLRDTRTSARYVRVSYRIQALRALRLLKPELLVVPHDVPGCSGTLCPASRFESILRSRMADVTPFHDRARRH